jgi:uncharacterized phage infection (PIP) family protein YhgE
MSQQLVVRDVDLDDLTDRGLLKATLAAVTRMENLMTQMNEALGRLQTAVTEQRETMQGQIDTLTEALETEREESRRLAEAEALEDVGQDQALADARATTDQALAELQSGVESINRLADEVSGVQGGGGAPAEGEQPAPDQPLPQDPSTEQPVDSGGQPQPGSGEVVDSQPVDSQPEQTDQQAPSVEPGVPPNDQPVQ